MEMAMFDIREARRAFILAACGTAIVRRPVREIYRFTIYLRNLRRR
jgi:hypothetical protein